MKKSDTIPTATAEDLNAQHPEMANALRQYDTQIRRDALVEKLAIAIARVEAKLVDRPDLNNIHTHFSMLMESARSINAAMGGAEQILADLTAQTAKGQSDLSKLLNGKATDNPNRDSDLLTPEEKLLRAIQEHHLIRGLDMRILELEIQQQENTLIQSVVTQVTEGIADFQTSISMAQALVVKDKGTAAAVKEEAKAEMNKQLDEDTKELIQAGAITTNKELADYQKRSLKHIESRINQIDRAAIDIKKEGSKGLLKAYERFVVQPLERLRQPHGSARPEVMDRRTRKLSNRINAFHQHIQKSDINDMARLEEYLNEQIQDVWDHSNECARETMQQTEFTNQQLEMMFMRRQKLSEMLAGRSNKPEDFKMMASMLQMDEKELIAEVRDFRMQNGLLDVPDMKVEQARNNSKPRER